jgi:hypothetical protein
MPPLTNWIAGWLCYVRMLNSLDGTSVKLKSFHMHATYDDGMVV